MRRSLVLGFVLLAVSACGTDLTYSKKIDACGLLDPKTGD